MLDIGNLMNKTLFISDVHLGSRGSNPTELYKLLNKEQPEQIFIVGDFIDGWLLKKRFYWTKECTDVKMPERVKKMPSRHKIKLKIDRKAVHVLKISFFSKNFTQ